MDRRTFALASFTACSMPALQTRAFGLDHEASKTPSSVDSQEFRFDEAVDLELRSTPVKWQGGDVHLLSLDKLTFSLDSQINRLTVNAKGSLLTFDNVDYTIGVAVFAADETMLGSTMTTCSIPRIWLGTYGKQPVDLNLDFGISNNFANASKFQACISDCTVLTPDQWQDG